MSITPFICIHYFPKGISVNWMKIISVHIWSHLINSIYHVPNYLTTFTNILCRNRFLHRYPIMNACSVYVMFIKIYLCSEIAVIILNWPIAMSSDLWSRYHQSIFILKSNHLSRLNFSFQDLAVWLALRCIQANRAL